MRPTNSAPYYSYLPQAEIQGPSGSSKVEKGKDVRAPTIRPPLSIADITHAEASETIEH